MQTSFACVLACFFLTSEKVCVITLTDYIEKFGHYFFSEFALQ